MTNQYVSFILFCMAHPLDGVKEKIERAKKHIEQFAINARKFERDAYTVRLEPDIDARNLSVFAVATGLGDPPIQLSLLAGEAVHQLRSSLDHVVFILAKKTPKRSRQFPIFIERDEYESSAPCMIKGVSLRAEAIIEAAQPFHLVPSDKHPLRMLNKLNNTDKHQVIPVCSIYASHTTIDFGGGPWYTINWGVARAVVKDGTKIGTVPLPHGYTPEMKMDSQALFTVAFAKIGNTQLEPVVPLLIEITDFVDGLIGQFMSEF